MNSSNRRTNRNLQEAKYFILIVAILLALIFVIMKLQSMVSYAEEVVLAEAPYVVGGNNVNNSSNGPIDILNGGNNQDLQRLSSNITYDPNPVGGTGFVLTIKSDYGSIGRANENAVSAGKDSETNVVGNAESKQGPGDEKTVNETDIYVPDSDDDCPVSDLVPLSAEVQQYIWSKCKKATSDYKNYYAFMLGAIQLESSFRSGATHKNSNGTIDRGICQINSSNIKKMIHAGLISSSQDLFDTYLCIDCGFWLMNQYIQKFGVSESAYYAYNTGRETGGSNKNSRIVMGNMSEWKRKIFG